ncbi:MAG: hypothetical protein GF411_18080 [Candidatus Lokiarchaeota archaeon]|nr:hypothetical protein [Candidatus Lokiarchaeota archaeon]
MSKIVFDEPIIRIRQEKIRFPKICPVCTEPATKKTRVTIVPGKKEYITPSHRPGFTPSQRRRLGFKPPETRTFLIPVCEDHYFYDESDCRFRSTCVCFNGILFSVVLFATFISGNDLSVGRGLNLWYVGLLSIFIISLIGSAIAFRPKPIQDAIRVVGFDLGAQHVWLKLKNPEYQERFVEENAMNVDLVKWIIKAPSRT